MPRPREFDEEEVLANALDVFWTRGYEATSLAHLMDATGLAKGSLYKAFGDKKRLFLRALDSYSAAGCGDLRALAASDGSGRQLLEIFFSSVAARATCSGVRRGCFAVNCSIELGPHDADVRNRLRKHARQMESTFTDLIRLGVADGSLRKDLDPKVGARWITTLINGLQVRGKIGLTKKQAEETVQIAMAALL